MGVMRSAYKVLVWKPGPTTDFPSPHCGVILYKSNGPIFRYCSEFRTFCVRIFVVSPFQAVLAGKYQDNTPDLSTTRSLTAQSLYRRRRFDSRREQKIFLFFKTSRLLWGPPSLLVNGYCVFLGGKSTRVWRSSPTLSSAEVKERAVLYFYSLFGASWPVLG